MQVAFDDRAVGGGNDHGPDIRVFIGGFEFGRPQFDLPFRALVAVLQPELRGLDREIFQQRL